MLIKAFSVKPHCVSRWTIDIYYKNDTRTLQCQVKLTDVRSCNKRIICTARKVFAVVQRRAIGPVVIHRSTVKTLCTFPLTHVSVIFCLASGFLSHSPVHSPLSLRPQQVLYLVVTLPFMLLKEYAYRSWSCLLCSRKLFATEYRNMKKKKYFTFWPKNQSA